MTPEQQEQYLKWLDEEIIDLTIKGDKERDELRAFAANDLYQYVAGLKKAREKFLSLFQLNKQWRQRNR